jgi:hypothetical protein
VIGTVAWAYYGISLALLALSMIRGGVPRSYHETCTAIGLCVLWPITLFFEGREYLYQRGRRKRSLEE